MTDEQIKAEIQKLENKRERIEREIQAEINALRAKCSHSQVKSYPSRHRSETKCLTCGDWW